MVEETNSEAVTTPCGIVVPKELRRKLGWALASSQAKQSQTLKSLCYDWGEDMADYLMGLRKSAPEAP